jgi:hypothetical protein
LKEIQEIRTEFWLGKLLKNDHVEEREEGGRIIKMNLAEIMWMGGGQN